MQANIGQLVAQRATVSPDLEAYVEPETGVRIDYTELDRYANRCAHLIRELGIEKGERVALLLPNCVELVGLFLGAAKVGAVVVTLNTRLTSAELAFIVADSGARVLIHAPAFAEAVEAMLSTEEHANSIELSIVTGDGTDALGARLREASSETPPIGAGGDDNLFIMYTSGTTGLPKGAVHTHNSVFCGSVAGITTADFRYKERVLIPLPMFHISALVSLLAVFVRGGTLVSMPTFHPSKIWTLIEDERVSICGSVTAILNFMRHAPEFETFDSPHFRYFSQGGSPLPKSLIEIFDGKGIQVTQGYALTESCTVGTQLLPDDALRKIGSAGRAAMLCELCLRDEDGSRMERGTGEVLLRGDFLFKEYWNRPDATAEAFEDGWFRTGDIAEIDEEGFVYIKDRLSDMIISGGENIYPAELENVILSHPSVREVAVIGVADESWGEVPCAVVVSDGETLKEADLLKHCEGKLSRFKLPKKAVFVDAIPRNPAGKALKRILREQVAAETSARAAGQ